VRMPGRAGLMRLLMLCVAVLSPQWVLAHEMTIAEMDVRQTGPGSFTWQWLASNEKQGQTPDLYPHWPDNCQTQGNLLNCGEDGLRGKLSVAGIGDTYSAALIKVWWDDGYAVYTLTGRQPTVQLFGSAKDERSWTEIFSAYTVLGVEHILGGIDHLLFVISLLFLVGFRRQLLLTITAFTAAHSLTLALSALELLSLRPAPVEASIALSIMLVAREAFDDRPTLARRWPAIVAFLFGLVHGLGFAGALKEIGLPQAHLPIALLSFNVGVEIGQLMVIALVWVLYRLFGHLLGRLRVPALYAIGSIAAFWSIGRIVAIVS